MTLRLLAEIPFPGIDPVALQLGPFAIRWYGLAYLLGFMVAGWCLDRLGRRQFVRLTPRDVSDLIGYLVVGVMVGARLGYALVYEHGLLADPLRLIQVWRGGLSFHGGLIGVVIMSGLFARRHGITWRRLADALALSVPFGIFYVRCANFINAELYGRIAPASVPWAMRFPTDPIARALSPELSGGGSLNWYAGYQRLRESGRWEFVEQGIPLRHPSQLYEGLYEGALMALVLWLIYRKFGGSLREGAIASLFVALYAVGRFFIEFTRQPDAQLGLIVGPLSMGQLLSGLLLLIAASIYWWPSRNSSNIRSPGEPPSGL